MGQRQRMTGQIFTEPLPAERSSLAAAVEPVTCRSQRRRIKPSYPFGVTAHSIVLVVAPQLGCQRTPPFLRRRQITDRLEPPAHLPAFLPKLLAAGSTAHQIPAFENLKLGMHFDPVTVAAPGGPGHVGHRFDQGAIHRRQNAVGGIQTGNPADLGQLRTIPEESL